jgi:hypothetical protein
MENVAEIPYRAERKHFRPQFWFWTPRSPDFIRRLNANPAKPCQATRNTRQQNHRAWTSIRCYCRCMNRTAFASLTRTTRKGEGVPCAITPPWHAKKIMHSGNTGLHVGFRIISAAYMNVSAVWNVVLYIPVVASKKQNASFFRVLCLLFPSCLDYSPRTWRVRQHVSPKRL